MRHTLSPQLQLGEHDVSTIKFDALSRDDIPQLLRGLQHLYDDKEDRDAVLYVPLVTRGYLPLFRSGTKITPS